MVPQVWVFIVILVGIVVIAPLFAFRPLILAFANRIAGKNVDTEQLKLCQKRVQVLEQQVDHLQQRLSSLEDSNEFSQKLLGDKGSKRLESK